MTNLSHKILFCSLFFFSLAYITVAQPKIVFSKESHNFGFVAEGSVASYEFTFVNEGNQPLVISNVKASCGCTTPFWTKEPVAPGKTGTIKASYNSKNRPGNFSKSITITSNTENPIHRLYIKGMVDKLPEYTTAELAKSPKLTFAKNTVKVGRVEAKQAIPISMDIRNTGASDLSIKNISSDCNCVGFGAAKDFNIPKGERKTFTLVYRPGTIGRFKEEVLIYSNDLHNPTSRFTIEAEVVDNLQPNSLLKKEVKKF